jgi:ribonucleoside-diphosphate reductase alpha chain
MSDNSVRCASRQKETEGYAVLPVDALFGESDEVLKKGEADDSDPFGDTESVAYANVPANENSSIAKKAGLTVSRRYTIKGHDVFKTCEWELRTANITGGNGETVFKQEGVEVPKFWSQMATNVVSSKYFRGQLNTLEREFSVKQLVGRVADTFYKWGKQGGYFATDDDAQAFHDELRYILIHQLAAFNSPVWFNLGWPGRRQAISACYINEVADNMETILDLYKTEGLLFKDGSGSGLNLSVLRSSKEPLTAGGRSSGPISFMKGLDASAGSIKSGGSTRRAACMRVLDVDHPDIVDFISCKADAEKKAHALIEAGYSGAFNVSNGAYDTVPFQNANHSVRVSDDFMKTVERDGTWHTKFRTTGEVAGEVKARDIMQKIGEATWVCGDPGMQYDTTINDWHTCANTDRIYASNPCSEYMFLNSTACNLSSLNLMRFRDHNTGAFDVDSYQHATRIMITAQEIGVGFADYPTPKIEERSFEFRTLGLGYANLGALLMAGGLPYDSDAGRAYAASLTAIMTGTAYAQSATIARDCGGPFSRYAENREPMLRVIYKHRDAVEKIDSKLIPTGLFEKARESWDEAKEIGTANGFRNAQATVLAPTGTIGFLMDCDTTGVEPDIAIVKYKSLVGGGLMKIVNQTVPEALRRLGYSDEQAKSILNFIDQHDTIEGAPELKKEHLPIFDCAFRPTNGTRTIHYSGHIRMMSATQPFLSGAISKTVNVPEDATAEEISNVYFDAWKMGLKAIAIYRDGSKKTQPLSTKKETAGESLASDTVALGNPVRRKLPDERPSITHKFSVGGHEGYLTVGLYPDTQMPGEIFLRMSKEGSTISGLMDGFATAISLALQYGVPLSTMVDKFIHSRFEPSGFTGNKDIPMAKSVMDYIFRWLALKFLQKDERHNVGLIADIPVEEPVVQPSKLIVHGNGKAAPAAKTETTNGSFTDHEREIFRLQSDAPPCPDCGALCIRSGACYKCPQCGTSLGCS